MLRDEQRQARANQGQIIVAKSSKQEMRKPRRALDLP